MSAASTLPVSVFPAWALLNNVQFASTGLGETEGKGLGLVAQERLKATSAATDAGGNGHGEVGESPKTLLHIPRDLVLSAAAVKEYANVDQNFRQLLDAAGHKSTRHDILIYLLVHIVISGRAKAGGARQCASTPWTEYIKFLPRHVPVPTMWTADERTLLNGTSLETALEAKLTALTGEFDALREKSAELTFWNALLWEKDTATIQDWILADAWYRSRSLELPRAGHSMVPGLDMANHSHNPNAYYDEDDQGGAQLILRPGVELAGGEEVTITYGDDKSAAEMLFSYGFIDPNSATRKLVLPLYAMPQDPLGKAKIHIFDDLPSLKLSRTDGGIEWSSAFAYLMCLNEEDGLEFRVLQDTDGERQLKLFWQEEDVTGRPRDFETLIRGHPLEQVFRLRVVVVLHELVSSQLAALGSDSFHEQLEPLRRAGQLREECIDAAATLRQTETELLESAAEVLEEQRTHLLTDDHVVAYFGSMEVTESGQAQGPEANDDVDFS